MGVLLCFGLAYLYQSSSRGASPGGQNPGNNLHVSGLSHRVDSRDLENHFAAIGRVGDGFICAEARYQHHK